MGNNQCRIHQYNPETESDVICYDRVPINETPTDVKKAPKEIVEKVKKAPKEVVKVTKASKEIEFVKEEAIALYNFPPHKTGDSPLSKGEQITVLEKRPSGWWLVQKSDERQGVVPCNYIALLKNSEYAVANFNYDKKKDDPNHLTLEKGDNITVLKKDTNGWWMGKKGDNIGVFPANYVSVVEKPQEEKEPLDDLLARLDYLDKEVKKVKEKIDAHKTTFD
jgi:hypothetical protein